MKSTLTLLVLVFTLITSCDDENFRWDSDPPEVRINWLNQAQIESENAIGDIVNLELALEFSNMPYMYSVDFKVHFDHTLFNPDSFDYQIFPSFFTTGGEVLLTDVNSNGEYDASDGDEYQDSNGNNQWDAPTPYPIGIVRLDTTHTGNTENFEDLNNNGQYDYGENFQDDNGNLAWDDGLEVYFSGALGIPSPENAVPSNAYGSGQVCKFYLSGVYTATIFDVEIVEAVEYEDANIDPTELSVNNWDIYPYLVGNPHDPVLRMQQQESDDNSVVISIEIGDSPKLSRLQKTITYDPAVLSYNQNEILDFFDLLNYQVTLLPDDNQGEILLEFIHNDADQISSGVDEASFAEGNGSILNITFLVNPNDSIATLTIPESSVSADSYNFSIGESYPLDMNFWTIEESLQINF
ncbi:MAG: hypothetical protein CBD21_02735 [bacterium TMED161]|nr:MAG: hypothetical protein CBD21_02735 [bacterium TMED161]|tara:strand:- start:3799 stop:5028 length:1230 start_codon:yes stop_codon:yes gene_type:complete